MATHIDDKKKIEVYKLVLNEPTLTYQEIADRLNLSRYQVSRAIRKLSTSVDYRLAANIAGKFMEDFQKASDFWKMQITAITNMMKDETDKELMLKLLDAQSERYKNILFQARQGEIVEALRLINKGMLPQLKKEEKKNELKTTTEVKQI